MAKLSNPDGPRVPLHAVADIVNRQKTIQVNHCRNPACTNYGTRPRTMPGRTGPSAERDPHYRLHSTHRGRVPALLCKSCGEIPPIKSNAGIAAEIARLIETDGLWTVDERTACKNADCRNIGRSVALHPREYTRRGYSRSGGQVYKCRMCGHTVVASTALRVHRRNRERAADVLSRLANKAPKNGIVRGAELSSSADYYSILNYIHDRCREHSAAFDRAMIEGRVRLPEFMAVESDAQSYMLNWTSRLDRRNVEIFGYCSVHSATRYVLGLHANYDAAANAFKINAESAGAGEMSLKEAYRKHAQYWLVGDDLRAGRSKNFATKTARKGLALQIEMLYAAAASRADVEDIELEHMDTTYRTPFLKDGALVHMPYTTYAHWYLLRRLLTGAGVRRTQFHFDIDSTSRAAFLCSFIREIKERRAHAFYVKYDKNLTIDERRAIVGNARSHRHREQQLFDPEDHDDIDMILMKRSLMFGQRFGKWDDEWFEHPNPNLGEPHKAMSWLTPDDSLDEDTVAEMFLRAGIARVDNVFQLTRRLFNPLEKGVGTPSHLNAVWHGYQPYNPTMIQKYLTIFRAVNNFIQVGKDGRTPAMRLGLMDRPMSYGEMVAAEPRSPRHAPTPPGR